MAHINFGWDHSHVLAINTQFVNFGPFLVYFYHTHSLSLSYLYWLISCKTIQIIWITPFGKSNKTILIWVVPSSVVCVGVVLSWGWAEISLSWGWVELRLSWVEAELELKLSWDWSWQVFELFNWSIWRLAPFYYFPGWVAVLSENWISQQNSLEVALK